VLGNSRSAAQDMAASLLELGLVKRLPGAPVSNFYPHLVQARL